MNILLIDNFDSFTFNLAEEFKSRGAEVIVIRNEISADLALQIALELPKPRMIVISPGPGAPENAGCSVELIKKSQGLVPVLGICLGHQAIVTAFGGIVSGAESIMHGKTSAIEHDGEGIFTGLISPMNVGRYHSLTATVLPDCLKKQAHYDDIVMAVVHKNLPIVGLQFHPESILTTMGGQLIANIMQNFSALEQ